MICSEITNGKGMFGKTAGLSGRKNWHQVEEGHIVANPVKADISVIIPVINEQAAVNQAVEQLQAQDFQGIVEIVVVDGGRDHATIRAIEDGTVVKKASLPGRGIQMNQGALVATGEILLFLHCDTVLPENGLKTVATVMADRSVKAGAFDLTIARKGVVWRLIEKTASLRSRITRIPYGDQAIFVRRSFFFETGLYRNIPIMEDVDLMLRMKKRRARVQFCRERVSTSARRWEKEGVVFCTLRNWLLVTLFFFGVDPARLERFYRKPHA